MIKILGKHFSAQEFACKCVKHAGVLDKKIDNKLIKLLDDIRIYYKRPVYILSGYRCYAHNKEVGGVPDSFHCRGLAADIYLEKIGVAELASACAKFGADGIGRYPRQGFVHVDVRGYKANWEEY